MGVPRARLWSFWQVAGGLAGALQPEDLNRPGGPRGCRGRGRTLRSLTLPSPSHQRHRGPCWEPGRAAWKPGLRRPGPARERLARCPEPVVTCLGPAVEKRASAGKLRVPCHSQAHPCWLLARLLPWPMPRASVAGVCPVSPPLLSFLSLAFKGRVVCAIAGTPGPRRVPPRRTGWGDGVLAHPEPLCGRTG